jgi:tetratricopeptide (TPR) repeat protein
VKKFRDLIAACLLIGILSSCGTPSDSAEKFVASGKALVAEGKIEKAKLEFKNAIQVDPEQAEPFYQMALLDEKEEKRESMFANLSKAIQLSPNHYEAIVKLSQVHLLAGNPDAAMDAINPVLAADRNNVMALVSRGLINMKKDNISAANQDIEQALGLDPTNTAAISAKALILQQQGRSDRALIVLSAGIKKHPDELSLRRIKLSILEAQERYEEVEVIYKSLMVKYPDAIWVPISMAKLVNMQGRYNDSKQILQQFIVAHPDEKQVKLVLISLMQTKEPEQVMGLLERYIQQDKFDFDMRFAKVKLQLTASKEDAAVTELKRIIEMDSDGNNGRQAEVLLAGLDLQNGDVKAAETKVQSVLTVSPEDEAALLLKANIEMINKDTDIAITDLRVVLRNNPESEPALLLLAQAYMLSGSTELADDNFRQALAVNPRNTVAALSVANNLMQSGDLNRTEEVLVKALIHAPHKVPLLEALAQVRILMKDWPGSKAVVDTLRAGNKESAVAYYFNARISQEQGYYSNAIEDYKLALAAKPDMSRALQGLAYSSMQLGQQQALLDFLKNFIVDNPRQFAAYKGLSSVYSQDESWDEAINIVEKGLALEPKWQSGYSILASTYLAQNKKKEIFETYLRGIKANPGSSFLSLQLASAYELSGDFEKARALYETVLAKDQSNEPAINNLAALYTDRFNSKDNLERALDLSSRFKDATEPYYLDTYAWVNVQLNNLDEAQPILEQVVKLHPNVAAYNYHLGVLYNKKGNAVKAKVYLNKAKGIADEQGNKILSNKLNELLKSY